MRRRADFISLQWRQEDRQMQSSRNIFKTHLSVSCLAWRLEQLGGGSPARNSAAASRPTACGRLQVHRLWPLRGPTRAGSRTHVQASSESLWHGLWPAATGRALSTPTVRDSAVAAGLLSSAALGFSSCLTVVSYLQGVLACRYSTPGSPESRDPR